MKKITEDDVLRTIEVALQVRPGSLGLDATAENVEGWDSLGHLSILAALDKIFEGKVADISEIADVNSVSKIFAVLRQHSLI